MALGRLLIYQKKRLWDANGYLLSNAKLMVERYKVRLEAKGFTQTYGIDYYETFAPVAKINSI